MEALGVPSIVVVTDKFVPLADTIAMTVGRTDLTKVVIPHPFGGLPEEEIRERAALTAARLAEALRQPAPAGSPDGQSGVDPPRLTHPPQLELTVASDTTLSWALDDLGLTDGLPVTSPTPERVDAMLRYSARDADEEIGPLPPSWDSLTIRSAAANAVMAGCKPAHFPVLMQALQGMLEVPEFNLYGIQTTTHPLGPMLMISGPLAGELGLANGAGALGPGWAANLSVGRALRLLLMNGGGARPGGTDAATMGQPGKIAFCFAENEADSPWEPYRTALGFDSSVSTFTTVGAEAPHNISDHGSTDADGILRTMAGTLANMGHNNFYWLGDIFVLIGPEHAASLAREGLSRADVQRELHRRARVPASQMSKGNLEHIQSWHVESEHILDDAGLIPLTRTPQDINVVVVGGPGKHSMWVPTWFRSITRPIVNSHGEPAQSVEELRQMTAARADRSAQPELCGSRPLPERARQPDDEPD
jgi:hypothetical protein